MVLNGTGFDMQLLFQIKNHVIYNNVVPYIGKQKNFFKVADASGFTLLHFAAQYGNRNLTKYLIACGAQVNAINHQGITPLMQAIISDDREPLHPSIKSHIIEILLKSNAHIHLCDKDGRSVWQMLSWRDTPSVQLLVKRLRNECLNNTSLAEKLIDANCPLPIAVLTEDAEVVKLMLDRGLPVVDPKSNVSALEVAIRQLDADVLEVILKYEVNVHEKYISGHKLMRWFGLAYKNTEKHLNILKLLLDHGAHKFYVGGERTIDKLLELGNRQTISLLFSYDLDFLAKDNMGRTILHYLASNKHADVLDEIRGRDLDFTHVDSLGFTPLHLSVKSPKLMEFLIENGADIESTGDGSKMTPLFRAFSCNLVGSVEVLLKFSADPQVKHEGLTMFHTPLDNEQSLVIEPILAHLVLREGLGIPIDENIVDAIQQNQYLKKRYDLYNRQIERIKNYWIYDSINLFTLLTVSEKQFALYLRNRYLASEFSNLQKKSLFINVNTYYCNVLRERLDKVVTFNRLRNIAVDIVSQITGFHYDAYPIIIDNIISNFGTEDLHKLEKFREH